MILTVTDTNGAVLEIDLKAAWMDPYVAGESDMFEVLFWNLGWWTYSNGETPKSAFDAEISLPGGDDSVSVNVDDDFDWLREVCKLYSESMEECIPDGALLGYIENQGWKWVNFDNIGASDDYESEYDGDAGDFAREHMEEYGEDLPEHLKYHFDYDSYGEALLDEYDEIEFDGQSYLFRQ